MSSRLIGALAAFLMTLVPATMIFHIAMLGQELTQENLYAVSPLAVLAGVGLGLFSAAMTWRHPAYMGAAARSSWIRDARTPRPPIGSDVKDALRKRTAVFFVVALLAMIAVMNAWWSPGRGPLSFAPHFVVILPALLITIAFTGPYFRRARDRAGAPTGDAKVEPTAQMPDAPAARPLPGDAAARSFGRADRVRTSRLPPTADALDWGLLAPLFGGGCLFLALGVLRDSGPAFLAAAILFGMAAAMGYDRQVGVLLRRVALPGLRHALLLLACCVTMLLLLTKLDLALKPLDSWHATPVQITIDLIGRSLSGLAAMLLALPLFAALVRKSPADGQERPLWPLYAALAGGGLCCYLLAGQWNAFTWPARYGTLDWLEIGMTAPVMPPASLLIGASLSVWWQSLTRADMPGLDRNRLFPAAIRSALIMTALPLPVFVIVSSGLFGPVRSIVQGSATLSLITCLAWLYALWRILPLQPTSGLRALGAAFALNLLLAAMFGIAGYKGWDPYLGDLLQLLVGFPVLLTGWWLVVKKVPRWVSEYV